MNCQGCKGDTVDNAWGHWCDACGGVVVGTPPRLFFRHVATVDGAGGRFPIVYDISAQAYGVAWPKIVTMIKCVHCGMQTPGSDDRKGLTKLDDSGSQNFYSKRGTLDAMLAFIQPIAKGDSEDFPEISANPNATDEEKLIVLG